MTTKQIKIKGITIRLLADNMVENIIENYTAIDVENVLQLKEINKELTQGKQYSILVNAGEYTSISKEARELSASKQFAENTVAKALLVNSLGQRIIGNFYININKPFIKTKVFEDRDKAIEWLKEQIKTDK